MTAKLTAGRRLRRDLDAALREVGEERGLTLVWTVREVAWISLACSAADRAEALQRLWDAAQGEGKAGGLVRLSGELRQLERQVADLVGRLEIGARESGHGGRLRLRLRPGIV